MVILVIEIVTQTIIKKRTNLRSCIELFNTLEDKASDNYVEEVLEDYMEDGHMEEIIDKERTTIESREP